MNYTLISLDISTEGSIKEDFIGGIFRGWLGSALRCDRQRSCDGCDQCMQCPYYMVFKEKTNVRPYSILAFKDKENVRAFIRLYGDKRKMAPHILSKIHGMEGVPHFGGHGYSIGSIEAKNLKMQPIDVGNRTRLICTSPLCLKSSGKLDVLPSFNTILRSCIRTYNRVSKYHDQQNYPFHVPDDIMAYDAEMLDFDVHVMKHDHITMKKKTIKMDGVTGWMDFDTSSMPPQIATILGMGGSMQIGKHSAYGFGGLLMLNQEEKN